METNQNNPPQTMQESSRQMIQFITGKWISKPIYVAAELGISDLLAKGPKKVEQLAAECKVKPSPLYRILRALAGFGIFTELTEQGNHTFANTPMSECLKKDIMRPMALMFLSDWHNKAWDQLLHSVKSGTIAFESAHGIPAFQWLERHPDAAEDYHQAQAAKAAQSHSVIVEVYDFSKMGTITDTGGGYGSLMIRILQANPRLEGRVVDNPDVIRRAEEVIASAGLSDRCKAVPCDFFKEIPAGSDAYILSHILHDWEDEQALAILKNCHRAMSRDAKLLILEMVIPEGNEFSVSKLLDLEVLVMGGGKERTESEFRALLDHADFNVERIISTPLDIFIIECTKLV